MEGTRRRRERKGEEAERKIERPLYLGPGEKVGEEEVYIGNGNRKGKTVRSLWGKGLVIGGRSGEDRCRRGDLKDLQIWTAPLRGRVWRCDCGKEDSGECFGWTLRSALRRVRKAESDPVDPLDPLSWTVTVMPMSKWKQWWRDGISARLGLPETGILLKRGLLRRPTRLGEFLRQFPSAHRNWPSGGRREYREPMPLPLPMVTEAERDWDQHCAKEGTRRQTTTGKLLLRAAGRAAWIWLSVMMCNYMYCGGVKWEARLMGHKGEWTETQKLMMEGFERRVGRFLGVENGLTPGGPMPVRWEPDRGRGTPRVGEHEDAGGTWMVRKGVPVEFPPRDFEEKAAGYGSVAVAKAPQLTVGGIIEALPPSGGRRKSSGRRVVRRRAPADSGVPGGDEQGSGGGAARDESNGPRGGLGTGCSNPCGSRGDVGKRRP